MTDCMLCGKSVFQNYADPCQCTVKRDKRLKDGICTKCGKNPSIHDTEFCNSCDADSQDLGYA